MTLAFALGADDALTVEDETPSSSDILTDVTQHCLPVVQLHTTTRR